MQIAPGIHMLDLPANAASHRSSIHPTLLADGDALVLVDAGYPGQLAQLRAAVEETGAPFERLTAVLLTHHDIDHLGGLAEIQKALPGQVKVLAGEAEKAYVQGDLRPLKLAPLEDHLDSLSEDLRAFYPKLKAAFQNSFVPVDQTLSDGQELPCCGGAQVVFTPGHTLGHICLYFPASQTLVAGDALRVDDGQLIQSPASTNYDAELYLQSLRKLAEYAVRTVVCYHGGLYQGEAAPRIAALADGA